MPVLRIAATLGWAVLVYFLHLSSSAAEKRVALVVGNSAYKNVGRLVNPTNDAKSLAAMLQSAGFDAVQLHQNLGIRELRRAINDFSDISRDADVAVIYYSGHGIELNGLNYLIPVDAVLDRDTDVPYETFSLDNLLQVLEPTRRVRLIMLDACRDNPFMSRMKRTVGTRAIGRGLAPVEPSAVNTLVGFAAKAGSYALDGEGVNSPYAAAVLNNLTTPGLDLRIAFGRVRDEVLKTTRNRQEPFLYGSLGGGTISLVDTSTVPSPSSTLQPPLPVLTVDRAAQAWSIIQNTTSTAILEDYIKHFASTVYGSMARARLDELKRNKVAPATTVTSNSAASVNEPKDTGCRKIVGTWIGNWGPFQWEFIAKPNGTILGRGEGDTWTPGTWTCSDGKHFVVRATYEDRLTMSNDGNSMTGLSSLTGFTVTFSVRRKQ